MTPLKAAQKDLLEYVSQLVPSKEGVKVDLSLKFIRQSGLALIRAIKAVLPIMQEGVLTVGAPRVVRTRPHVTAYHRKGRYVCLQASLLHKGESIDMSNLICAGLSEDENACGVWRPGIWPALLTARASGYGVIQDDDEFVLRLNAAGGPNWKKTQETLAAEARRIFQDADLIIKQHLGKTSGRERRSLQKKFASALQHCGPLVEADPKAVVEFFKIGWQDVRHLSAFIKRNQADCSIVELEDIVEAQNLAKVQKVMKE